jgi:Domain of unknown function (DUF1707)
MPPAPPPGGPASRLGDADRDRLIALLREHYALGRLDLDQLSHRAEIVLAADYADEAAAALRDLPPLGPAGPPCPGGQPAAGPGQAGPGQAGRAGSGSGKKARRRHAQSAAPGAGWVPTSERFRDPTTGTIMRVWLDPADQSRHYVPDTGQGPR